MATSEDMADPDTDSRERLGEALDSVAPPPAYSPFARRVRPLGSRRDYRSADMRRYGCCGHCEHDINDAPHDIPCPEGCTDDDE